AGATIALTDAQNGDVLSLQGQPGTSGTLASGITFSISGATVTFSNVSSLTNYQAALQLVQFNNTVVNPSTTDRTFSIEVDDGGGVNNTASATATVTVGAVNHAPVISVPGTSVNATEDTPLNLINASVSDPDAGDILTATLNVSHGSLVPLGTLAGLTILDGDGSDGSLMIQGSASAVSAALTAGVTYTPTANFDQQDTLTIDVSDNHGGSDSKQVTINITSVNDAPVVNANGGTLAYTENQAAAAIDTLLTVSDV